jgi:predicted component of type VI protein secretion system
MKLVIEDEAGTRSIVPFAADTIVVGRGTEEVTFRLGDRDVSRRHARFLRHSGAVFVEDLGSAGGTRVNGERITGRRKLRAGDLVQIGDYDLAVLAEGAVIDPGAPPPPPLPAAARLEPARADSYAATVTLAAIDPTPPADVTAPTPAPAPQPAGGRVIRVALAIGVVALAVGLAVGWAVGAITGPTPLTPP